MTCVVPDLNGSLLFTLVYIERICYKMLARSTANLVKSIIGAGVLSVPWAFARVGSFTGIIMLILFGWASKKTGEWLLVVAQNWVACGKLRREDVTYERLLALRFPRWVVVLFGITAVTRNFCIQAIYLQILADILGDIWPGAPVLMWHRVLFMSAIILPLLLIDRMSKMGWVSFIGAAAVGALIVTVIANTILYWMVGNSTPGVVGFVEPSWGWLSALSVAGVAYACHLNILPIWAEGEEDTSFLSYSISIAVILYMIAGTFGYARFGPDVDIILLNSYAIVDGNLVLSGIYLVVIIVSYLLLNYATRLSFDQLFGWTFWTLRTREWTYSYVFWFFAFLLASFVPEMHTLFSFAGGLLSTVTMIIMPSLLALREPSLYGAVCETPQPNYDAHHYNWMPSPPPVVPERRMWSERILPLTVAIIGVLVGVAIIVGEVLGLCGVL